MLKEFLKRTIFYDLWNKYRVKTSKTSKILSTDLLIEEWVKNGRPVPSPPSVKQATIKDYARLHGTTTFVETGTFLGDTTTACLDSFERLITIELDEQLFNNAVAKFSQHKKVSVYRGDSGHVLAEVLPGISEPTLFWLDGHYSDGFTAKGSLNTPILNELKHVFAHPIKNHTILIDDARCFTGEDDYPTVDYLREFVHKHDGNLIFSVDDDIIRIHSNMSPDLHHIGNSIYSSTVQPESLLGHHIEVREGTSIDQFSKIGSYVYIGNRCVVTKANIGRYCSIADNVTIGPGEHNLTALSTSAIFYENILHELTKEACEIGNDVWIGVDSIIKRGVKIGNGAIIGANSVVTKDVPPFAIVVGSPAKILRFRFDQSQRDKLTTSNWWNLDVNLARKLLKDLGKTVFN
jgi:virginiamycin A acetyltransferase